VAVESGQIHRKQSDTWVRTLRKEYGEQFAKSHRGDMNSGRNLRRRVPNRCPSC
jgi:hypothetical protein